MGCKTRELAVGACALLAAMAARAQSNPIASLTIKQTDAGVEYSSTFTGADATDGTFLLNGSDGYRFAIYPSDLETITAVEAKDIAGDTIQDTYTLARKEPGEGDTASPLRVKLGAVSGPGAGQTTYRGSAQDVGQNYKRCDYEVVVNDTASREVVIVAVGAALCQGLGAGGLRQKAFTDDCAKECSATCEGEGKSVARCTSTILGKVNYSQERGTTVGCEGVCQSQCQ